MGDRPWFMFPKYCLLAPWRRAMGQFCMQLLFLTLLFGWIGISQRVTDERLRNIGQVIGHLKSLESLILSFQGQRFDSCSLSPGYQHHFVHHEYQECCPTLRTVVFGSFMAWHLPAESEECHCGLELLSSRMICQNLRRLKKMRNPDPVFDWEGKLACLLSEGPLGLSEKDIKRIIKPSSKSSCSVCPDN